MVDVCLRRGFHNDGQRIEINNDDEDEERFERETFENPFTIDGKTYRLPERGVKLDFLDKVAQTVPFRKYHPREFCEHDLLSQLIDLALMSNGAGASEVAAFSATSSPSRVPHMLSPAPSETYSKPSSSLPEHDVESRSQILALKTLMQVKGKEALMAFLTS